MKRFEISPLLLCDFYKIGHVFQYPENTTLVYSNFTPRKSRIKGIDKVVFFGLQYFIKEYLIRRFNEDFFERPLSNVINDYASLVEHGLGENAITYDHIAALHKLGYLPIIIKALPEGSKVDIKVPCLTIYNTKPEFYWLPNFLETILSTTLWQSCTSATIAHQYRKIFDKYALETTGTTEGVQFQGHDFSMRGMSSSESACLSGAGHLLSFNGTDSIPAIKFLIDYYNADPNKELIGCSVPATEHSVMCAGSKEGEFETFKRLITKTYPKGIVSIVCDTWDLWQTLTEYAPNLKKEILSRDGKVVFRPDSGIPEDILCGDINWELQLYQKQILELSKENKTLLTEKEKGVIELLWDVFGGTIDEQGYKVLDPHIGAIYGDSITLERAEEICRRLKDKGFASINWVAGIGLNMAPLYRNI